MHIYEVGRKQIGGVILWYDNDFYAVGIPSFCVYKHFSQEEPPFSLQLQMERFIIEHVSDLFTTNPEVSAVQNIDPLTLV